MATEEKRDEIEEVIRQACNVPAPDEEFVRTLAARARGELLAAVQESPGRTGFIPLQRTEVRSAVRAWKRAAITAAALAAAILAGVLLWPRQEALAWDKVAEAVRALPWIHIKAGGEGTETWLSFSKKVTAWRDTSQVTFEDLRSGVHYEYDRQKKKLYRLTASDRTAQERGWAAAFFQAIVRGDAIPDDGLFGTRIVRQRQRTVTEKGRRWIVYELELGDPTSKPPTTTTVVIRVDPQKKLPDSMTVTVKQDTFQTKFETQVTFDYPAEGPADIYALGVPRNTPVEDRTPPPELSRILDTIRENRRKFDNYFAVAGGDDPSRVYLVRCKGDKFRVDVGAGDVSRVTSPAELETWWHTHGKQTLPRGSLLCDGRDMYEQRLVGARAGWVPLHYPIQQGDERAAAAHRYEGEYFVEFLAYPLGLDLHTLSSPNYTARLDPKGENGPAGSLRVVFQMAKTSGRADREAYHKLEYWLQPKYGYAVVKSVASECPRSNVNNIINEYDGFRQTPHGLWYPTVSREKNASYSPDKTKPGGFVLHDKVTYFYLDFTAKLPDELFTIAWCDPPTGVNVAPRGNGPASNDLRAIRPPGGVPLFFGVPGKPISVEGVERTRQRLEAVPPADLEKWVVELERIIGKKLNDGLPSSKQACRTDFAMHLSLAFDGVRWNTERADELFKRAQTLPASEAKIWKEAFEAVLKKQIGQTDKTLYAGGPDWAVPLVLIPVDALYDGQKYSPDRAKKYLARMKQLTADDVALWQNQVDQWGGTRLDAAMNIILLDHFFDGEKFQRDKFRAAIEAIGKQGTRER